MLEKRGYLIINKTLRLFVLASFFCLSLTSLPLSAQDIYKSKVEIIEHHGIHLELLPETLVDSNLSLEGDFFSAFLTKPSAELLNVPLGSRLLGKITEVQAPKNFGRSAKLTTHVSELMLPDGSRVKVSADFSSKTNTKDDEKPAKTKNFLKKLSKDTTELSAGAMVGAVDAVQFGGISTAIMTSGLSVAAGAALGLGLSLAGVTMRKGDELVSSGFDPINFKLESDFEFLEDLPAYIASKREPVAASLLGIDMRVNKIDKYFSRSYGEFILMDIELKNNGIEKIYFGDFVLSSGRHIMPIYSNPLISNEVVAAIDSQGSRQCRLAFSLGDIKKSSDYKLMMINPVTQEIVAYLDVEFAQYI